MAESALERTARALDLIPFLSNNPGLTINEIAEKFASSPAQIFKDLEMLFMCGLPGHSHSELIDMELSADYVAITNPQNLDKPRRLSRVEITSLTLGLELLIPLVTDPQLRLKALSLQARFAKLLSDVAGSPASVFTSSTVQSSECDAEIEKAIASSSGIEIKYRSASADEITTRLIYPISTYSERGYLYTVAHCVRSGEERHFRHDRITGVVPTAHTLPADQSSPSSPRSLEQVDVLMDPRNRFFLEAHASIVERVEPHASELKATFTIGDREWLTRELLALPGRVEILGPADFAEQFYRRLDAILNQYR